MKKKVSMIIGKLSVLNWSVFKIAANSQIYAMRILYITGNVRAMYVQIYSGEQQVLQAKTFTTVKNAEKWANKIHTWNFSFDNFAFIVYINCCKFCCCHN